MVRFMFFSLGVCEHVDSQAQINRDWQCTQWTAFMRFSVQKACAGQPMSRYGCIKPFLEIQLPAR
jgi:hypothetical protein